MRTKKKIETKGPKSIKDYTLDECFAEARNIQAKGVFTSQNTLNRRYPIEAMSRFVQVFFRIRELGGNTSDLRSLGFTPGSTYRWIVKYATPEELASLPRRPRTPKAAEVVEAVAVAPTEEKLPEVVEADVTDEEPIKARECCDMEQFQRGGPNEAGDYPEPTETFSNTPVVTAPPVAVGFWRKIGRAIKGFLNQEL